MTITKNWETDWAQKYRPITMTDCILPDPVKRTLEPMASKGAVENVILYGGYGVGKTSVCKALCRDVGCDLLEVNGSLDNGIGHLRNTVESFAYACGIKGGKKVVLLDEADGLSREYQDGLRGFMDRVSSNCAFLFTTNHLDRISGAIRSRCLPVDVTFSPEETQSARVAFGVRVQQILEIEGAMLDERRLAKTIGKWFPEFRQILKQVQLECRR